jgi:membrane-associated phospholipid phosphatase
MSILIPAIRGTDFDRELALLDFRIWGANPTVWLERLQSPWFTELLQIFYSLFVPCVLLVAFLLWRRGRLEDFRQYAFLIAAGFLVSYIGYFLVPARGPRFLLKHLQATELKGLWLFQPLQAMLDRLESAHYDCFPSGHTELTMLAWWGSRKLSSRYFTAYLLYTLSIIFATIYLRYHYTVDVLAGAVVAAAVIPAAPRIYDYLKQKGPLIGRHRDRQC